MAKLNRYTQKIFGSAAGTNQIAKFGSLFAGSPQTTTDVAEAMSLSNWLTGWLGAAIGSNSPAIEDMNASHYVFAYQLAYLMQSGVPEWDAGTEYHIGQMINLNGTLLYSFTNANIGNDPAVDTANWKVVSTEPVGTGKDYWGSSLPRGYIWGSGLTIGNASSNATERANADTFALFSLLWSSGNDTTLPIYTSGGVLTTRGVSALVDWNNNRQLSIPDKRGRVSAGKDDMGGSSANRLTTAGSGIDGDVLGNAGGTETHTLSSGEMPSHTHTQNAHQHITTPGLTPYNASFPWPPGYSAGATQNTSNFQFGAGGSFYNTIDAAGVTSGLTQGPLSQSITATNQNTGGGGAHQNTQPTIVCNYIIKL